MTSARIRRSMTRSIAATLLLCCAGGPGAAEPAPIEARTAAGDVVLLHPNGRWAYVDQAKAEEAKKVADTYPENHTRPIDAQGGWLGIGRTIIPGDKDYNRGSMSGKGR